MPPQRRRTQQARDITANLPPEPVVNPEEAAVQGSPVRRQGPRRPEVLPPGRRNQPSETPARRGTLTPTSTGVDEPVDEISDEEIADRAAARLAARFDGEQGSGERDEQTLPRLMASIGGGNVTTPAIMVAPMEYDEVCAALIDGVVLLTNGGSEEQAEEWIERSIAALTALAPQDPLEGLGPVGEFLWGVAGVLRDTPEE